MPHGDWLHEIAVGIGTAVAAVILYLKRAGWSPIRWWTDWLDGRHTASDAHRTIPGIQKKLDEMDDKIESGFDALEWKSDRNAALISYFHGNQEIPVAVDDILDDESVFIHGDFDDPPPDPDG